jgi:hypothetical protein
VLFNQISQNLVSIFQAKLTAFLITNNVFREMKEFLIGMQVLSSQTHDQRDVAKSCIYSYIFLMALFFEMKFVKVISVTDRY